MFERLGVPGRFFRTRIRPRRRYTTPMKANSPQDKRILEIAEPLAETLGLEIVRVRVLGGKKTTVPLIRAKLMAACSAAVASSTPVQSAL